MAMRPPVAVPTLSRRAKLVLGAVAVLLVLFTAIGTLTNVYVDYLWFDETRYTEVFWTELQTRALLFGLYAIGLVPTLLIGGTASDRWGRRAVVLPFVALSPLATLALVVWSDWAPGLGVARL